MTETTLNTVPINAGISDHPGGVGDPRAPWGIRKDCPNKCLLKPWVRAKIL